MRGTAHIPDTGRGMWHFATHYCLERRLKCIAYGRRMSGGKDLKGRAGLLALSLLLLTLVPMWAAVIGEIRHERVLTEAVARKDAMNLATAFEAHVRSVIRLMDMFLLDMRADLLDQRPLEQTLGKEQQAYGSVVTQMAVIDAQGRLVFSILPRSMHRST